MIVLDLICEAEHRFEAWFASSQAFEQQQMARLVNCPVCNSTQIRRLPSAPYVQTGGERSTHTASKPALTSDAAQWQQQLMQALRQAAARSEDVGERFAEEARRIHYGDAEERAIRGQSRPDEIKELVEEGIPVLPVPPDEKDMH
ncbi:DUF1178 family protein [Zoogloea sp.]|uniref:DUF1178 family protein n=1 Tax=Zoogloea sp. TaxID=49181 RepID=UPI0035B44566